MDNSLIAEVLGDIGENLAIDITYLKVKHFLEDLETRANGGDGPAQQVLEIVNQFDRLVKMAKKQPYTGN